MQELDLSLKLLHTSEIIGIITEQNHYNNYTNLLISKLSKFK